MGRILRNFIIPIGVFFLGFLLSSKLMKNEIVKETIGVSIIVGIIGMIAYDIVKLIKRGKRLTVREESIYCYKEGNYFNKMMLFIPITIIYIFSIVFLMSDDIISIASITESLTGTSMLGVILFLELLVGSVLYTYFYYTKQNIIYKDGIQRFDGSFKVWDEVESIEYNTYLHYTAYRYKINFNEGYTILKCNNSNNDMVKQILQRSCAINIVENRKLSC